VLYALLGETDMQARAFIYDLNDEEEEQPMNKLKRILLLVSMMALVVCISVGATIAYLTDDEAVVNTFTVGQVGISLDEAKVNTDGSLVTGSDAGRVHENEYHLLPGHTYPQKAE